MNYEQILFDTHDAVGVITLNRPERMNAWTYRMAAEMRHAIEACNNNDAIAAMVITGQGRGFCAGADIKDTFKSRLDDEEGAESARDRADTADWVALVRRSKPIIAAVNGASVGVGATMILPADVIIAARSAKFAMGFIKMGLVPELASSHFLVQRMGFGKASELCLSGRMYPAEEAFATGLVDRVVDDADLMDSAMALAGEFAANPTPQLRWIKELLTANGVETDLSAIQRRELEALQKAYNSPEHKEAVAAFLEKRPPKFR